MADQVGERHQLAGFDDQERGFNRPVEFVRSERGMQAVLRYERKRAASPEAPDTAQALRALIALLQHEGYTQLRTQQSYRDGAYLGSQEPWIEYPDPPKPSHSGRFARLKQWFLRPI